MTEIRAEITVRAGLVGSNPEPSGTHVVRDLGRPKGMRTLGVDVGQACDAARKLARQGQVVEVRVLVFPAGVTAQLPGSVNGAE